MKRVVVVGGGILGTMHALFALKDGFEVIHLERDREARSASVRNFGLIWVSGRRSGAELKLALRARALWQGIGEASKIGFRPNGSLTIAKNELELEVMEQAVSMNDARERGFTILSRSEIQDYEPSLQGKFAGGLRCSNDAIVEPNLLFPGLRNYMQSFDNYQFVTEEEIIDFDYGSSSVHVYAANGAEYSADYAIFCPGASISGFLLDFIEDEPIRNVRLQMAATSPMSIDLRHSIADADSLRYYPAFSELDLAGLGEQSEIAAAYRMQLLLAPRLDGSMTIGDTHEYVEPFSHELIETPYKHLTSVIESFLGSTIHIDRRWEGIYTEMTNGGICFRKEFAPNCYLVTGGGGRGNTLAPAIAEESIATWQM